ncbi:MAG: hypothetical protein IKX85_04740, partial [Clostridia bacterium]|nr:hypothetical protein [Clostridia bacterium]
AEEGFETQKILKEDLMDLPFRAVGECAEEAILKSMLAAGPDRMLDGRPVRSLAEYLKEAEENL